VAFKKQNPVADISLTECNRVNAAPKRLDTTRFSASQQRKTTAVVAELARRTSSLQSTTIDHQHSKTNKRRLLWLATVTTASLAYTAI
jgi:hypothetical protein